MLFFSFDTTDSAEIFRKKLEEKNIISGFIKKDIIRLVFHKDVEIDKVDSIVEAINYSSSIDI
jgi:threonine aldolase